MDSLAQLTSALAGRYTIDREVGRGGMATVYLARDVRHDRLVALKVLSPELGAVLGVERFLAEIRVTANLQHPNLLPLFDSGEASAGAYSLPGTSLLFYVMPYVEGESLRARLDREKQLPVEEALHIAVAIAGALDYAHRNGVIHRDLKPENILLHEGQPLIADFGIALAVSNAGGSRVTQTGLSLGTPQYMSPEQATGDRAIDGRSDIYSLAAVTYEMLSGEPPHSASTAQAVIARLLTESPRSVRIGRPAVPEHVDAALARALEKLPADRFGSAGAFADALQGRGAPGSGARAVAGANLQRGLRSRLRDPVMLAALGVALIATGVAVAALRRAPDPEAGATVRLSIASANLRPDAFVGSPIAVSPDGRTLVYSATGDDNNSQLYVRPLESLEAVPLPATAGAFLPFFSPDGRWIGFWAAGRLQKIAVDGGSPVTIGETPLIYGAAWSASGDIVVSTGMELSVIPETGGRFNPIESSRATLGSQFPVMLDDDLVAFSRFGSTAVGGAELGVASIRDRRVWMLGVLGSGPLGYVDGYLIYVHPSNGMFAIPFDLRRRAATGDPIPLPGDILIGAGGAPKGALAGNTLAYHIGSGKSRLLLVARDGTARPFHPGEEGWSYPRLSPDGSMLAIARGGSGRTDIWVHDIASATATRLTTEGAVNERPEWSPDGRRVVFRTDRGLRSSIWWQPIDRSGPAEPLIMSDKEEYWEGVLTPDGKAIVFQLDTLQSDIYYRLLDGDSTNRPIAVSRFPEDMARVSPDGRWVAFQSEESGRREVVVQPFPGPGPRYQVSADGGAEPLWARDGSRIYFRQGRGVFEALVATDPRFRVLGRRLLFEGDYLTASAPHANYDVLPDGSGFVMVQAVSAPVIVVTYNWRSELRRLLAQRRGRR
jgi:eukaryotic-like serine/threonine-protein kinase